MVHIILLILLMISLFASVIIERMNKKISRIDPEEINWSVFIMALDQIMTERMNKKVDSKVNWKEEGF
jgi:hypothetical protein